MKVEGMHACLLQVGHGSAQFANLASGVPEANPNGHGASYCNVLTRGFVTLEVMGVP